jgi:hypothetical protein
MNNLPIWAQQLGVRQINPMQPQFQMQGNADRDAVAGAVQAALPQMQQAQVGNLNDSLGNVDQALGTNLAMPPGANGQQPTKIDMLRKLAMTLWGA